MWDEDPRKAIKLILHMLQCCSMTTVGVGFFLHTQGETWCNTKAFLPNESLVLSHWMPDPFPWLETVGVSEDGALWLSNPSDDEDCIFHAGHHFWPKFSVTGQRPTSISWGYWHGLISIPLRMFAQSFTLLTVTTTRGFAKTVETDQRFLSTAAICHTEGTSQKWKKLWYHCVSYQHCHFWSSMILRWPHWFVDFQKSSSLHEFLGSKGPLKGIPLPGPRLLVQRGLNIAIFCGQTASSHHYTCSAIKALALTWWFTAEAICWR